MLRRKKLENWSPELLAKHVRTAYSIRDDDTEDPWVMAIIVLHQNPERLPRRDVRQGIEEGDFFPYMVLEFFVGIRDLVTWRTTGKFEDDPLTDAQGYDTLAEARSAAAERMTGQPELAFGQLPTVMQDAFIASTKGQRPGSLSV